MARLRLRPPPNAVSMAMLVCSMAMLVCSMAMLVGSVAVAGEAIERVKSDHLGNLIQVHRRVLSGGQPDGDAALAELKAQGVTTVISVDGLPPAHDDLAEHGLRCIHLPVGYDGINSTTAMALAKAITSSSGAVYVHCHHGKHRGPAAAAVGCITAGLIPPAKGQSLLSEAGTDPAYVGLHAAVAKSRAVNEGVLERFAFRFRPIVAPESTASAMAKLSRVFETTQGVAASGWKTHAGHADATPRYQARLLTESFREMLRREDQWTQRSDYRDQLAASIRESERLEAALDRGDASAADRHLIALRESCKHCHQAFRN